MGLIDLHVHAGPSVMPRELDGVDMYKEAVAAGYSAYVIKDHYFPTMMSAENISRHMDDGKCKVYGGLALNNSVGGLNLKAVDAACALGAKIIWMPTVRPAPQDHAQRPRPGLPRKQGYEHRGKDDHVSGRQR